MIRLLAPLGLLLLTIGVVVVSDRPHPRADFTFINRGDVATLDLQKMSWMQDFRVARALYEGLVKSDPFSTNFDVIPGVAEKWEVSEDKRTYTFHLRSDARWSNGQPVRAADFVYAWRRGLMPDTACDYAAQFQLIKGGKDFYDWREKATADFKPGPSSADDLWKQTQGKFDELVGAKAVDDRTLRVELERPTPYFLELCTMPVFAPVYPPLVSQYEKPDPATGRLDIQSGWTKPPVCVGNGPFMLTDWRFKQYLRLEKNPYFWGRDRINIDTMDIPSNEDPNGSVLAFNSGAVDWVSDVTPPYRRNMLEAKQRFYAEHQAEYDALVAQGLDPIEIDRRLPPDPRKSIQAYDAFGTYFYNFNCEPRLQDGRDNPFHDPRVRRAFAMAIDRKRIAGEIRGIGEHEAATLVPPGSIPGYRSPRGVPYDPAAARALLAEAGYPGGKGFITVELLFNRDGGHDVIAQAMAKDFQENLGVNVMLAQKEVKVFRNDVRRHNFMLSRGSWFGDYGDPTTFLDINKTDDGNNDRKYSNPVYDALLDRAANEADPAKRLDLLAQAEAIIVDQDLPVIPIFQYRDIYLFNPDKVSGISSHMRQEQNIWQVDMLGDGKGTEKPLALPPRSSPPAERATENGPAREGRVRTRDNDQARGAGDRSNP